MCFSAEADFVAAAVLAPIGIASLASVRSARQLPLALIPCVFAAHQFTEAFVWLGFSDTVSGAVQQAAIDLYLIAAQVVLPVLVPLAMALVEPDRRRRLAMGACGVVGVFVAVRFSGILVDHGAIAYPFGNTVAYKTPVNLGRLGDLGYLIATCGPPLLASSLYLWWLGVANLVGVGLASLVRWQAVTSIWCLYAAFVSVLILIHLRVARSDDQHPRLPRPPEWTGVRFDGPIDRAAQTAATSVGDGDQVADEHKTPA